LRINISFLPIYWVVSASVSSNVDSSILDAGI
jgi:hypothetical protein